MCQTMSSKAMWNRIQGGFNSSETLPLFVYKPIKVKSAKQKPYGDESIAVEVHLLEKKAKLH